MFEANVYRYNTGYFSLLVKLEPGFGDRHIEMISQTPKGISRTTKRADFEWAREAIEYLSMNEDRPWVVMNGPSTLLGEVSFNTRQIEALRGKELAVFLYEPLFLIKPEGKGNWQPRFGSRENFISLEMDSILRFAEGAGRHLKIQVYTCDDRVEELFAEHPRYRQLRVKTFDLFLSQYVLTKRKYVVPAPQSPKFDKKLICLNFRYDIFRELIVAYLRSQNLLHESFVTFFHRHEPEALKDLPFDFQSWSFREQIEKGLRLMRDELPYSLDSRGSELVDPRRYTIPDMKPGANRREESEIRFFYQRAACVMVPETRFFTCLPNLSEKTLNAALHFKPFLLAAPPLSLDYLRRLGFQSFSAFWSESYDLELNHQHRLEKIFQALDQLFALTPVQLSEMIWEMTPVLYHNYFHFRELRLPIPQEVSP